MIINCKKIEFMVVSKRVQGVMCTVGIHQVQKFKYMGSVVRDGGK